MTNNTLVEAELDDFETTGASTNSNIIVAGGGSGYVEVYYSYLSNFKYLTLILSVGIYICSSKETHHYVEFMTSSSLGLNCLGLLVNYQLLRIFLLLNVMVKNTLIAFMSMKLVVQQCIVEHLLFHCNTFL